MDLKKELPLCARINRLYEELCKKHFHGVEGIRITKEYSCISGPSHFVVDATSLFSTKKKLHFCLMINIHELDEISLKEWCLKLIVSLNVVQKMPATSFKLSLDLNPAGLPGVLLSTEYYKKLQKSFERINKQYRSDYLNIVRDEIISVLMKNGKNLWRGFPDDFLVVTWN